MFRRRRRNIGRGTGYSPARRLWGSAYSKRYITKKQYRRRFPL